MVRNACHLQAIISNSQESRGKASRARRLTLLMYDFKNHIFPRSLDRSRNVCRDVKSNKEISNENTDNG